MDADGMTIGVHDRDDDLRVDLLHTMPSTDFRAAGMDEAVGPMPPIGISQERAAAFIEEGDLVEYTFKSIRSCKHHLKEHKHKGAARSGEAAGAWAAC